ncbi:transposable element Tcb2 transposase [Trichonephila clavipes]|nr:transposable element Tcb2 transposase [Trichonephila clavipes]
MSWPPNSFDRNTIEHLWFHLENRIRAAIHCHLAMSGIAAKVGECLVPHIPQTAYQYLVESILRLTSRWEDHRIVRNASVQPTASSAAIQAQVAPPLGGSVSSRTIQRRLDEGHLGSRHPLRVLPLTPTHRRLCLEWCRARGNWPTAEWNQVDFSDESRFNPSSDVNRDCVENPW